MTKGCESCRLIKAGVSKKTGKPYDAFYACDNPDCPNYKPQGGNYAPKSRPTSAITDVSAINKRLDSMATWMDGQFQEIMQKLIDIERK